MFALCLNCMQNYQTLIVLEPCKVCNGFPIFSLAGLLLQGLHHPHLQELLLHHHLLQAQPMPQLVLPQPVPRSWVKWLPQLVELLLVQLL